MLKCSLALSLNIYCTMIREFATKRLASPPRNHLHIDTTILSKGIPRKREIHPKISKNVDALTRKLTYAIKQKAASGTFDSVNTFLTSKKSVLDEQIDSDEMNRRYFADRADNFGLPEEGLGQMAVAWVE